MALDVYSVNESGVSMKFENNTITIIGIIDSQDPGDFMSPFFNEVHDFIISNELKSISINIVDLAFLNSSGIKEFVEWIMRLETLPDNQKYAIKFICSHEYLWQEPSIKTLAFLNSKRVSLEIQ